MTFLFLFYRDARKIAHRHGRYNVVKFLDGLQKTVKVSKPEKIDKKVDVKIDKPKNERHQQHNQVPDNNVHQNIQIHNPKNKPSQQQQMPKQKSKQDQQQQEMHRHHHHQPRQLPKQIPPPSPRQQEQHHHHHHHHSNQQNQNQQDKVRHPTRNQNPVLPNPKKERRSNANNRPQAGDFPRYRFENHVMVRVY